MLVLSRRVGEEIVIGDNVTITVRKVGRDRVSLAIQAPPHVHIVRKELLLAGDRDDFHMQAQVPYLGDSDNPLETLITVDNLPAKAR